MPTRTIDLTEHYDNFVDNLVSAGQFKDASDVMRAGLRMLEQQSRENEEKLELLRRLAKEGFDELDRGEGIVLHGDEELKEYIAERGRLAGERMKARLRGE